jgi:hypothetical protein
MNYEKGVAVLSATPEFCWCNSRFYLMIISLGKILQQYKVLLVMFDG